jgi:hypothetical protein
MSNSLERKELAQGVLRTHMWNAARRRPFCNSRGDVSVLSTIGQCTQSWDSEQLRDHRLCDVHASDA